MFSQLSVCPRVCLPHYMLGYTPPRPSTRGRPHRTRGRSPGSQHRPWTRHPHPQSSACWEIRAASGQCASYWNAYLLFYIYALKDHILLIIVQIRLLCLNLGPFYNAIQMDLNYHIRRNYVRILKR